MRSPSVGASSDARRAGTEPGRVSHSAQPPFGGQFAAQCAQQGGFACAVRLDHVPDLARKGLERQQTEHHPVIKGDAQVATQPWASGIEPCQRDVSHTLDIDRPRNHDLAVGLTKEGNNLKETLRGFKRHHPVLFVAIRAVQIPITSSSLRPSARSAKNCARLRSTAQTLSISLLESEG